MASGAGRPAIQANAASRFGSSTIGSTGPNTSSASSGEEGAGFIANAKERRRAPPSGPSGSSELPADSRSRRPSCRSEITAVGCPAGNSAWYARVRASRKAAAAAPTSSTVSGATQVWPALKALPATTARAARSRSASANTSTGHFPPSSSVSGVRLSAAARMTSRPRAEEPVKRRWSKGWRAKAAATSGPPSTVRATSGPRAASSQRRQLVGRPRRHLGGLQRDAVAGGERADEGREAELDRVVPGREDADDAERLRHEPRPARPERQVDSDGPRAGPAAQAAARVPGRVGDDQDLGEQRLLSRPPAEIGVEGAHEALAPLDQEAAERSQQPLALVERQPSGSGVDRPERRIGGLGRLAHGLGRQSPGLEPARPNCLTGSLTSVAGQLSPAAAGHQPRRARPERRHAGASRTTLPGFMMSFGSSARFSAAITATASPCSSSTQVDLAHADAVLAGAGAAHRDGALRPGAR